MAGVHARRGGAAVAVAVAVVLLGLEVATRTWLFEASRDFSRFSGYGARAERLGEADAYRVAFVGNSATEEGVDVARFADALSAALGRPVAADAFTADGSHLGTWRWILERTVWSGVRTPDLVVLPFFGRSLSDGDALEIGRVAQFFTRLPDWCEVLSLDLPDAGSRADFVVSSFWATWAARERIRERFLMALLPGYKAYVRAEHAALAGRAQRGDAPQSFARLDRVLALAAERNTRLCFVALPTRDGVREAEAAAPGLAHLASRGACLADLRSRDGLTAADFVDEIHLAESGRLVLTSRLAAAFARTP